MMASVRGGMFCAHKAQRSCVFIQRRYRYKKKWAVNLPSKSPSELALEHFDAFYKPLFKHQWPSIRISLLSLPKYAAIINNASESDMSRQNLKELGAVNIIWEAAKNISKSTRNQSKFHPATEDPTSVFTDGTNETQNHSEQDEASQELRGDRSKEHCVVRPGNVEASSTSKETEQISSSMHSELTDNVSERDRDQRHIQDMKNVLMPDTIHHSSDLEYFMPTQQVFSEKEELRQEEYSQSTFQERPISVSVLPGQLPMLPTSLNVMAFPRGNVSDFPKPSADKSHLLNYYLLDAASILPVLALDVRPQDSVLDLCAAPGGKTLALLQMIIAQGGYLTSNDVSQARVRRLKTVLNSYLPYNLQQEVVNVTEKNGRSFQHADYSKVLVDVPCNSDRHVLMEEDNNLFKPGRIKERLKMTTLQKDLLLAGIRSCKPGGSVVYSTCTLAAVQNDGVVQAALEELWETSDIDVVVEDLSPLTEAFAPFFKFHSGTRLGQLVLPSLVNNFGPMYFCKLRRLQ